MYVRMYQRSVAVKAGNSVQIKEEIVECLHVCDSAAAMEELVCELRLFLDLLDREYLSAGVRERKMHLSNILHRVLSEKGEITRLITTHTLAEAI